MSSPESCEYRPPLILTSLQMGSSNSMPLEDSDHISPSDTITLRRVRSSSSLSIQEIRRSGDIQVSFDNPPLGNWHFAQLNYFSSFFIIPFRDTFSSFFELLFPLWLNLSSLSLLLLWLMDPVFFKKKSLLSLAYLNVAVNHWRLSSSLPSFRCLVFI